MAVEAQPVKKPEPAKILPFVRPDQPTPPGGVPVRRESIKKAA